MWDGPFYWHLKRTAICNDSLDSNSEKSVWGKIRGKQWSCSPCTRLCAVFLCQKVPEDLHRRKSESGRHKGVSTIIKAGSEASNLTKFSWLIQPLNKKTKRVMSNYFSFLFDDIAMFTVVYLLLRKNLPQIFIHSSKRVCCFILKWKETDLLNKKLTLFILLLTLMELGMCVECLSWRHFKAHLVDSLPHRTLH